jgi:hypothetical protein
MPHHENQEINDITGSIFAQRIMNHKPHLCANDGCESDLGWLSLADLIIEFDDLQFCSQFCLDEYLDRLDKVQGSLR